MDDCYCFKQKLLNDFDETLKYYSYIRIIHRLLLINVPGRSGEQKLVTSNLFKVLFKIYNWACWPVSFIFVRGCNLPLFTYKKIETLFKIFSDFKIVMSILCSLIMEKDKTLYTREIVTYSQQSSSEYCNESNVFWYWS